MDDLLENTLTLIIVIIILIFGLMFILSIIHLKDYKECNKIDFKSNYCVKYKDY